MDIVPIYKRVIGLDVHQSQITGCAITEQPDGSVTHELREFGGFKRDRKALAEWARAIAPDVVVMESTGIYWKSPYAALEAVGIIAWEGADRGQERARSVGFGQQSPACQ